MDEMEGKGLFASLEDEEMEDLAGGDIGSVLKYNGPAPKFRYPVAMEYGMRVPRHSSIFKQYEMPEPETSKMMPSLGENDGGMGE